MRPFRLAQIMAAAGTLILLATAVFVIVSYRFPPLHFGGGTSGITGKTLYAINKEGQHAVARDVIVRYRYIGLPMSLRWVF